MKKNQAKRQRTPKRGPGVAELEKILKEQQQGGQDSGTNHPPPPSPPSWPHLLPLLPNLELVSGGPEKALFPTIPLLGDNTKSSSVAVPPDFFPNFQSSSPTLDFYNSLVNSNNNIIPGSASATSSAATARLFHQIEHPSSQRSIHFNNLWTSPSPDEQEKIVSAKRPRGSMFTNMTMNTKESSSSSSSSFEINRTTPFNFDPNFRVTKRGFGGQLMSSTRSSQQAQEITNFMALGPSSSAPNEFADFNFRLAQDIMEGSQKRAVDYNKITFNSSLYESKSKGSNEAAIGSSYEGAAEAGADGVDLDLKL